MVGDNLTLEIGGEVSLQDLADGFVRFRKLIDALTDEVSEKAGITWVVDDLRPGSAVATIRGEAPKPEDVGRVVHAYGIVGRSLQHGEPIPYSEKVRRSARDLLSLLGGKVISIRFETPDEEWTVVTPAARVASMGPRSAFGAIEGRIETLTRRKGLRFILYDTLHDRAVACYLNEDQEELMRGGWGRRAIVEGLVTRDPVTGLPATIRQVRNIEFLPESARGSYRNARGVLPFSPDEASPEEVIRRLRDA